MKHARPARQYSPDSVKKTRVTLDRSPADKMKKISERPMNVKVFICPKGPLIFLGVMLCLWASVAEAKLSFKRSSNMSFGDIASSSNGSGTATISVGSNTKTVSGSVTDFGGSVSRAAFSISKGTPSGLVWITLPSSVTISKGGVTLTVDNFVTDVTNPAQLDGTGKLTFYVSARLSIPTNQSAQSGLTGSATVGVEDISAAEFVDASATISASIIAPIGISATTPMSFGDIGPSEFSGSLVLSNSGAALATNVTEVPGGIVSEGVFTVTGDGNAAYSVTLPSSATLSSGANTMTITGFNHDGGATPTIAGGGSRDLSIGATLNVGANQSGGAYTGTYQVIVNYN